MTLWLDAHFSPKLAAPSTQLLGHSVIALRDVGLREASDPEIFASAKLNDVVVVTKDSDFLNLLHTFGPPPKVIWVRIGNRENSAMLLLLQNTLPLALLKLEEGESVVEIR